MPSINNFFIHHQHHMAPCACISISLSALFIHTTTQYQLTSHVHAFWVVQLLRGSRRIFYDFMRFKDHILWTFSLCQIEIVFSFKLSFCLTSVFECSTGSTMYMNIFLKWILTDKNLMTMKFTRCDQKQKI